MSISQLSIFEKSTDANASLRGYQYQILRTLEIWLENYHSSINEVIYCEYEEDIFQKNELLKKVKFRQLKLYSTNFSFKSEEISKALIHFFMLHVKSDYTETNKEFLFETNTEIATKYLDNDADLLREWHQNQNSLSDELLNRVSLKLQAIIIPALTEQAEKLKGKYDAVTINSSLDVLKELTSEQWQTFAKTIKWNFLSINPDTEFSNSIKRIEVLIDRLPFKGVDTSSLFGVFYKEISLRAADENPDKRKIENNEIELLILKAGDKEQKWYAESFEKWKDVTIVNQFHIGEFYEILNAANFCRWNPEISTQHSHWLALLEHLINRKDISDDFRDQAVYEFLWLSLRPVDEYSEPKGDFFAVEKYMEEYFKDFNKFQTADDLERAQNLLHLCFGASRLNITNIKEETVSEWYKQYDQILHQHIARPKDINEQCSLLELESSFNLFSKYRKNKNKEVDKIMHPLQQIIPLLKEAQMYDVIGLSRRINSYIKLLIYVNANENKSVIAALESFSQSVDDYVEKRNGAHQKAKLQVERGAAFLQSNDPKLLLTALEYFHKAKDFWHHNETIEGYVLGLLNISQLYSAIGLAFAAKYYALSAIWVCVQHGDKKLYSKISRGFGLLFYADFRQGSWMSAMNSFDAYLDTRHTFESKPLLAGYDKIAGKIFGDYSLILLSLEKFIPELNVFVAVRKTALGELKPIIDSNIDYLKNKFPTDESFRPIVERKLIASPINDTGAKRTIRFKALGSDWSISFANDYKTNSIAEEVIATLQIFLTEIALTEIDFHLTKGAIDIELLIDELKEPEQIPSNSKFKWKVWFPYFDGAKPEEIQLNAGRVTAIVRHFLRELSLLPKEEFNQSFENLFIKQGLITKALSSNSYQRMYRHFTNEKQFDALHRKHFGSQVLKLDFKNTLEILNWRDDKSDRYKEESFKGRVLGRFKNSRKSIYLTVAKWKKNQQFISGIQKLRAEGWPDWQIVSAINSFILDKKAAMNLEFADYKDEKTYLEARNKEYHRLEKLDEKDCYVVFPDDVILSEDFELYLNQTSLFEIQAVELIDYARIPNLKALKTFLDFRLSSQQKITSDDNPLDDIQ